MFSRTSGLPYTTPMPVGAKTLCPERDEKIAVQRLHIHTHVGDRLRPIEQNGRPITVGDLNHLACWRDNAQRVRHLRDGDETGLWSKQLFVLFEQDLSIVIHWRDTKFGTFFGAKHLPMERCSRGVRAM